MQIYNWKKTSDFLQLLDYLQEAEDECIVSVGKRAVLGWFHIAFIKHLHPSKKIIFITKDDRLRKILKQSGYKHFSSIQEVYQYLPEGLQIMKENVSIPDYIRFHSSKFFSRFFGYIKYFKPKQPDIFEVKHSSWYVLMLGIVTILLLMI